VACSYESFFSVPPYKRKFSIIWIKVLSGLCFWFFCYALNERPFLKNYLYKYNGVSTKMSINESLYISVQFWNPTIFLNLAEEKYDKHIFSWKWSIYFSSIWHKDVLVQLEWQFLGYWAQRDVQTHNFFLQARLFAFKILF